MNLEFLADEFAKVYQTKVGIRSFFAPGRVNLIGEHTDYNGGHVFPCALNIGTYAVARKRDDSIIKLYSLNFKHTGVIEATINDLVYDQQKDWANYPVGVVKTFQNIGLRINTGFEVLFYGDIPNGAGLSSSASIELATSKLLQELFTLDIDMVEMAKLSQRSENEFIGVNCGIMDQFVSGMGKKDHAILLNTNTLHYEYVPVKLDNISVVIANSNKRRDLAASKYNERRNECETALKALQVKLDISSLGELTEEDFHTNKFLINNQILQKRAKHAINENQRTIQAVQALRNNNIKLFGKLMNESHVSLRDDYEVTGLELDTLVATAWKNGAIGSRMTGAGFGGCTISLVYNNSLEEFIEKVGKEYEEKIGYKADFYVVSIDDGARQI